MTFAVKEKDFRPYSIPKNDFISYVFDNNYYICQYKQVKQKDMNYYELTFTYDSPIETSIINDVLAAELGEIGFESFTENENGLLGYISDQLYNVKSLQEKLAAFPLENVEIHYTESLVESKDWNEEWAPIRAISRHRSSCLTVISMPIHSLIIRPVLQGFCAFRIQSSPQAPRPSGPEKNHRRSFDLR